MKKKDNIFKIIMSALWGVLGLANAFIAGMAMGSCPLWLTVLKVFTAFLCIGCCVCGVIDTMIDNL